MEEKNVVKPPKNILARIQVVHFGKILFNLQFLAVAVMVASVLSFLLPALYYVMLIAVSILTVFSIYAWYPQFSSLWTGGETLTKIATVMAQSWKFTVPIVLSLAVASIVCLCFDKNQKHPARIVISIILAVLAAIVLILKLINGGGV